MRTPSAALWTLLAIAACANGLAFTPNFPLTVRAQVHDPAGQPVEGATVTLNLPRYTGGPFAAKQTLTDHSGVAILTGTVESEYLVWVTKAGYYKTMAARRTVVSDADAKLYATGVQQFDLELKPIQNPIPMLLGGSGMDSVLLPSTIQPVAYDLEKGDWVAPWGKGVTADIVFHLSGSYVARENFDLTLTLTFTNPNDGIQSFEVPRESFSEFVFPYEAPLAGYGPSRTWHWKQTVTETRRDFDAQIRYIFRVRTELNPDGTVKHALYGYLWRDIDFFPGKDKVGLRLNYGLNSTGTRNLEVDRKNSVRLSSH
jgi:hypothetical protein